MFTIECGTFIEIWCCSPISFFKHVPSLWCLFFDPHRSQFVLSWVGVQGEVVSRECEEWDLQAAGERIKAERHCIWLWTPGVYTANLSLWRLRIREPLESTLVAVPDLLHAWSFSFSQGTISVRLWRYRREQQRWCIYCVAPVSGFLIPSHTSSSHQVFL